MGCDGGSIPRRDEMVKLKKKAEKAEKGIELAAKWRHCALSSEKLQRPVVACELGRLYNKETVLMTLLDKTNIPDIAKHLRSLKDVVELQLTPNPSYKPSDKADTYNDMQSAEFICPVTGQQMNGHHKFIFFRQCGCVISDKALKEVPSETCHKRGKPFVKEDITVINGTEEEMESQRTAMEERRKAARLAKRKRKAETQSITEGTSSGSSSDGMETSLPPEPSSSSHSVPTSSKSSVEDSPLEKKSKVVSQKKPKSTKSKLKASSSSSVGSKGQGLEKRDAYKSLFTSSVPARPKEQTSHWVTFFPYH